MELMICWWIPCFAIGKARSRIMAGWRRVIELTMTDEEIERLTVLSRSRTEAASRVSRAQMLLAYRENPSFCAVGQRVGVHHQTVQRCVERALAYGPLAAIEARPRPGQWARMSRQAGPRHGVQDPRAGGDQTAQGSLLSGTPRC